MSGSAWSNQVQNQIIVVGSPGGVLSYSPSIGANNLISSVGVAAQFTDPYGNLVLQGTTSYNLDGGTYQALNINQGQVNWFSATTEAGPWTAGTGIDGRANVFNVGAGTSSNGMQLLVQQDLFRFLDTTIAIGSPSGMDWTPSTGLVVLTGGSGLEETWHSMTLTNSWANVAGFAVAQYRLVISPPNSVEIIGAINAAAATAAAFFTLPAGYRPAHSVPVCSMGANASVPANLSPWIQCTSAGVLSVQNTGAVPAAWESFFHGFIPLDA